MVARRGGMRVCSGEVCVVAPGGHAWLLLGGACMVAPGGCALLLPGGMCGCSRGGVCGCFQGVCIVAPGGHVWLLLGGACVVAPGGVHGFFDEIRSMSGRYASYWNAFLFQLASFTHCTRNSLFYIVSTERPP